MTKQWILVIDSGNGGRYTLQKLREVMPNENYLFFMDKANCPYGNKTRRFLKNITYNNINVLLKKYTIKAIVIACNTINSVAFDYIKSKFLNLPIFSVSPCLDDQKIFAKNTLILGTKLTIKYNEGIRCIKKRKNIFVYGFADLAKRIDNCKDNYDFLQPFIDKKLNKFRNKKLDNVVLACTHFNFIKPQIENALKTKVDFFENSQNLALEVRDVLKVSALLSRAKKCGTVFEFYSV